MTTLSVIIPAYNEESRLGRTLEHIRSHKEMLEQSGMTLAEVIVSDDGSTDTTCDVARSVTGLPITVLSAPNNQGKGAAMRRGMLHAKSDLLLMYDADGATPMDQVPKLWRAMQERHADIAIGSRVLNRRESLVSMRWHRRMIGRTYHALCQALVPGIEDTACGCKLFEKSTAHELFNLQKINRFAFDVEVLALALRRKKIIAEVPVTWTAIPESKVRILRDGLEMFWCVLRLYVTR